MALVLAAFIALPLMLGLLVPRRAAWAAWAAATTFMVVAQAFSGEVQAFTVMVAVLAMFGSVLLVLGQWLRRARRTDGR